MSMAMVSPIIYIIYYTCNSYCSLAVLVQPIYYYITGLRKCIVLCLQKLLIPLLYSGSAASIELYIYTTIRSCINLIYA